MSGDKSSLSTEVQQGEPTQTINNQDIRKDDLTTATTPVIETPTTKIPDSDANNQSDVVATEPSTSQTPDSDANKQADVTASHDSPKSSTTMVPASSQDSNTVDQTNPPKVDTDTKQDTNQSTKTTSSDQQTNKNDHGDPLPTTEPSTTQIPDSDANKQANTATTNDPPTASSQDSSTVDQTNPPKAETETKQDTNQSTQTISTDLQTNKNDHGDPLPTTEPSTSQIPDSDANKQSNTSSTTLVPASNQDSNTDDQTNPPKADTDTKQDTNQSTQTASTDQQTNKDDHGNPLPTAESFTSQIPDLDANKQASNQDSNSIDKTNPPTENSDTEQDKKQSNTAPDEERKRLLNLIHQEIEFIKKICPKLNEHEQHITDEVKKDEDMYTKLLNEQCEIKDLINLKKAVTKLKLQIPPRYRTSDKSDLRKNLQTDIVPIDIPTKLQKKLPRLHDKHFHESSFCRTIHLRFNQLSSQLKLCLLCFTVFPENAIISRRSMVYWWIGEGLTPQEDELEIGKTAEDYANDFFKELMDKDFIEPAVSRSPPHCYVAFCKMHPMIRAALVMIADSVKFLDFDKYGNPKDFGKFDEIVTPDDIQDIYPLGDPNEFFTFFDENKQQVTKIKFYDLKRNRCQFSPLAEEQISDGNTKEKPLDQQKPIDRNKKHYFYQKKPISTMSLNVCLMGSGLSKGITWEKLHMLFNVKDDMLEFKPEWFLRMKNINVVFLGRWQKWAAHHIEFDDFEFEKSLDYMNNVRFFSLEGVSRVNKLPDSIAKLKTLMILNLRACHNLEDIPKTIGTLKYLTHLDISECYLLNKIPKEIANLQSLQVLKGFVVVVKSADRDVCTLQDLETLENLRKLSMYTHMKDFPQESHLNSLHKLEALRKLTILWGGQDDLSKKPDDQTNNSKKPGVGNKKKSNFASRVKRVISKKKWVEGSMRRMNAFNNSALGLRLEKLDLKCFPHPITPNWLTPGNLQGLKKLYIRGGRFSDLGQYQDTVEWGDSPIPPKETWNVEILRLKYLEEVNMEWRELHDLFPKLTSLEKVKCPKLTLFPCNEYGVWIKKGTKTT